ncbi:pantoate--beta-alanine ligase [Geomonas sp. Red32]|uniref:pantoate--beta-alanine ligase n=1 Tax=Geomonas sp. Red32 TaxID=2912856 RepID=UPI00202CA6F6|nr:pantoate--beta-alanine ligase [Geomonas sp. Red32]MCM0082229.1 pantoate--beta-alanine ligase [Geomonas sp. Red32]
MKVINSVAEMQQFAREHRGEIALVPTMGYLHEGHASLMVEARKRARIVVASIFVNPTQFGVNEDLDSYPRDLERDTRVASEAGVDIIFAPTAAEMYPSGYQTYVNVEELTTHLCGASRPGHFRGVTTVVSKLFNIVMPRVAIFGKKDFQQLAVIKRMAKDLNMDVEIVGMPIVREHDGLALSSRNVRLDTTQRRSALSLSRSLRVAKEALRGGEQSVAALKKAVAEVIEAEPMAEIDYLEFRDPDTLLELEQADERTLLALAVRIGSVRLIDNCILGEE